MAPFTMKDVVNLKPSKYLEDILFKEQSSAAEQLFERLTDQVFEASDSDSFVEICVQERNAGDRNHNAGFDTWLTKSSSELSDADFSCRGLSTERLSQLKEVKLVLDTRPPQITSWYMGENAIYLYIACKPTELSSIALKSNDAFRICFIRQRHPNSRLLMSRELFERLMLTFDIFPRFREFIVYFGFKHMNAGLGPPQLRFRIISANDHRSDATKSIGFECAYELRYVEPNPHYVRNPWRLRQTAIYQQHKFSERSSSWVVVSASSDIEGSIDQYIRSAGDLMSQCPFEMHLLVIGAGLSNWRPYVAHLSEIINEQSDRVSSKLLEENDLRTAQAVQELQRLRDTEDEIIDVLLALDSLHNTVECLSDNYAEFVMTSGQTYTGDHDIINRAFQTQLRDIAFTRKNVQSLHSKVQGTKTLLSSLQNVQNSTSFGKIGREDHKEDALLSRMTEKGACSASTLNVLTTSILIYLPIMVVCSFFSTTFVSMEPSQNGKKLMIASNTWWFAVVAAPMIIISLTLWYAWLRLISHGQKGRPTRQRAPWKSSV